MVQRFLLAALVALVIGVAGCSGPGEDGAGRPGGGGRGGRPGGGGPPGMNGGPRPAAAVPVEVSPVLRRPISTYIETNGALEADNEVDVVARVTAPIVELSSEEGMAVRRGELLARLDDAEIVADLEIAQVALREAELAFERAQRSKRDELISTEVYDQAASSYESAKAQVVGNELRLGYTRIEAPFDGWIITRYVDYAEHVAANTPLFRISDFDPLLCPVQVPERDLAHLAIGQRAYIEVEPWPEDRFEARVLRISPVVDASTGTIKVTLEVRARNKLRPGMFASVFIETASRPDALVIPRAALSLDSITDAVYVAGEGVASRREVELGYQEGDLVEITTGLSVGESVIVVGQDGLSDGTPIQLPDEANAKLARQAQPGPPPEGRGEGAGGGPGSGRRGQGRPDLASMSPEQLERARTKMRERGMSDEEIEDRIKRARKDAGQP